MGHHSDYISILKFIFGGYVYLFFLAVKAYIAKIRYETVKYSFLFSYTISNKWTHTLSMLVSLSSKTVEENTS